MQHRFGSMSDTLPTQPYAPSTLRQTPVGNSEPQCYPSPIQSFSALITPLTDLRSLVTGEAFIEFKFGRRGNALVLQWEPFEGTVAQSGVPYLSVRQTMGQMPPYVIEHPIKIQLRGVSKISTFVVDPTSNIQLKFYLDVSGSGADVNMGDRIVIPGGCVQWII